MPLDLTSIPVIEWLAQFDTSDQIAASRLLSEILMVDANTFVSDMRQKILDVSAKYDGPVALCTERSIRKRLGKPNRMFKEAQRSPLRAFGDGPPPVPAGKPYARETGSEAVVASIITGLVRADRNKFIDHPGPDQIRIRKPDAYIIVTDFIGSGDRIIANLESVWQLKSFKSWKSLGLMKLAVIAYSGTEKGVYLAKNHASKPSIDLCQGSPTIRALPKPTRDELAELCRRYGPKSTTDDRTALGYGDGGTLISFDHGMPNNAPLLLHQKRSRWRPLFPSRSAALLTKATRVATRQEKIDQALIRLREKRLSSAPRFAGIAPDEQNRILVLAALKRKPRNILAISSRTGLSVAEIEVLLADAISDGFVDAKLKPTILAFSSLIYLRSTDSPRPPLPKTNKTPYCPQSLRAPRKISR